MIALISNVLKLNSVFKYPLVFLSMTLIEFGKLLLYVLITLINILLKTKFL